MVGTRALFLSSRDIFLSFFVFILRINVIIDQKFVDKSLVGKSNIYHICVRHTRNEHRSGPLQGGMVKMKESTCRGLLLILIALIAILVFSGEPIETQASETPDITRLVFFRGGDPVSVERNTIALLTAADIAPDPEAPYATAEAAVRAVVAGPSGAERAGGLSTPWPEGSVVDAVEPTGEGISIRVSVPGAFLERRFSQEVSDEIIHQLIGTLEPLPGVEGFSLYVRDLDGTVPEHRPMSDFLPDLPPVPNKPHEKEEGAGAPPGAPGRLGGPPAWGQPQPTGALTWKSIFISQSHGWYDHETLGWITQRGTTCDIVEDFINPEAVNQYLVQYLWNAGAGVYTCRERDMNTNEVIVDDTSPGFSTTGAWTTTGSPTGYFGSSFAWAPVSTVGTSTATFMPTLPAEGDYAVYVWYHHGTDHTHDARYIVNHSGGSTVVLQSQQLDGYTWKHIGTYHFPAGASPHYGSVTISNQGSDPGRIVLADAVRFGGGMGTVYHEGSTVSGKPRWEESGYYFAHYMGCPECSTGTVSAMPRYAKWENEAWEDSLYLSWHTNAPNPGTGTSSFVYSSGGWNGPFTGVAGSLDLQDILHWELINDIRAGYDAGWRDRGQHTADFGEVNPYYNDEMPAVLFELAFHDTPSDALYLKDPKFRRLAARAFYQGIVKYFADRDGIEPKLAPETPTHFMARNDGAGGVILAWMPPPSNSGDDYLGDPATSYRIYVSRDGRGFENALETSGRAAALGRLDRGGLYYFRLTAVNEGGESFPTETLAVRVYGGDALPVLVVNAFDRIDRYSLIWQDDGGSIDWNLRMFLDRMNRYSYIIEHAEAIAAFGIPFDSCSNEAAAEGFIDLSNYVMVDWIDGEESNRDETLSSLEQLVIAAYLEGGGNLFMSGAEIAWDLDYLGDASDRAFYHNYLHALYTADDSEVYGVSGVPGSIFHGLSGLTYDDSTHGTYDVDWPDCVDPYGDGVLALTYDGTAWGAGIQADTGTYRVINLGFPFETIYPATSRAAVMARVMNFLLEVQCTDDDGDGYAPEGGPCGPADCDDADPAVHPGAAEICDNGVDDNCNGLIDHPLEGCASCLIGSVP